MIIFFVNNKIGDNMKKILFTGARSGIINKVIDTIINDYIIYLTVENDAQLKCVNEKYKNYSNVKCFKLDITSSEDRNKIKDKKPKDEILYSSIKLALINRLLKRNNKRRIF